MFNWNDIDTVLLDMDGTLLDLRFDHHFWLRHVPNALARLENISEEQAQQQMLSHYSKVKGTLNWYCIDYWSEQTNLNIRQLNIEHADTIAMRNDVPAFLQALKQRKIQRILLTNAHPDGLAIKIDRTGLDKHLDHIYSTHQFGHCKESLQLWQSLLVHHPFDPERTLFIDDNEELLLVAKQFGIRYVLGIENPNSEQSHKSFEQCPAIHDYQQLTKDLVHQ